MNNDLEIMKAMASLYRKKAAVMQALEGGMAKTGENTHFNYKFVTASSIKHTVGQLFATHGLSLQMSGVATENAVTITEKKNFKTGEVERKETPILRIQFQISLCDVDTGAVEQSFWFGEAGATDDKAASKCATSALKYYLISNLMIAHKDEDKRDTDNAPRKLSRPQETSATSDRGPQAKPGGASIKAVLDEYAPFMTSKDFEAMRAQLREDLKTGVVNPETPAIARKMIENNFSKIIDMDALRAARKESQS
jgi:hypothetical protein